jgi:hypothetical protein
MRGFRDALRADPALRYRYAALKRAIVAGGPVDPVTFTMAKHDKIDAALRRLGLRGGRRLYEEEPAGQCARPTAVDKGGRCSAGLVLGAAGSNLSLSVTAMSAPAQAIGGTARSG